MLSDLMIFAAIAAGLAVFVWVSLWYTADSIDGQDWMERDVR